ncbi:Ppx/GppA phosphatase family protein [Anaerocolumna sp. MB42-C2]|uniref:Ppx/GppA phosphatase family protein n=1 Tax=Anaerocolumna sp. MB42-C2 TaxID=3070997 RepID=UPI0027E19C9D|nr:phosphatase [Anaerocolumna sp. MB42-C2]WMJ87294.1 phosphatase [Anaerocolumna sp. MB42-C2]
MICAIIDLGSNTIRLCVYEYNESQMKSLLEKKAMAGLANYIKNEKLSNSGVERACEILKEFSDILKNFQVKKENTHIFATASLRNIVNTKEVIGIIKENTGFEVELLSGEEEATLDFIGATKSVSSDNGILVDIGGGSTELVPFADKKIQAATSMPIGSLNLYVKYVKKIIPKKDEREIIKQAVLENLNTLDLKKETYQNICGVGGTIRAAAKLSNHIFGLPKNNTNIEVHHIKQILELIHNSHKNTLTPILQNIPDRVHTIIPGLIIVETIMDYFQSENITVSKYGIREGYFYERILKGE